MILNFDPIDSMMPLEIVASKQNKQVYIEEINIMSLKFLKLMIDKKDFSKFNI